MDIDRLRNRQARTFVYDEQQPEIAQLDDDVLGFRAQPYCAGSSPRYSEEDLSQEAAENKAVENEVAHVEQYKKRRLCEDRHDVWFVIR